ncbi:MAG TPA: hypothetical protein VF678_06970 [bacterium]
MNRHGNDATLIEFGKDDVLLCEIEAEKAGVIGLMLQPGLGHTVKARVECSPPERLRPRSGDVVLCFSRKSQIDGLIENLQRVALRLKRKPAKVPCGCCKCGVFRKSPGKDAYVCSAPKDLPKEDHGGVCQQHITGEHFRQLEARARK